MFFLSTVLNLLSSYIIASFGGSFLIIFVAYFALIVLNIEILSLFQSIEKINIFIFSIINFILVFLFWKNKKFPLLKININFTRIKNSLLLDKSLIILLICFLFMLGIVFFLANVMPALEPDSQTYHFIRAVEFLEHKRLLHFETVDVRALIMPFNSEIIYTWMYAFKDNFRGFGIVSYISYMAGVVAIFDIFLQFRVSYRKILWTVFILSSLPATIVQLCTLQTDIIIGSLILISIALFLRKNKISLYFSSLAYCLALGTKSTAIICIFGLAFIFLAIEFFIFKDKKLSQIKTFILYSVFNFLIFSSYNYILNYIDFQNPFSNQTAYFWHKFQGGYKGFIANIIRYFFQFFDFTGFKWGFYLNDYIFNIENSIFHILNIDPYTGYIIGSKKVNILSDEQNVGFGILGFILILPVIFYSFLNPLLKRKSRLSIFYFIFAAAFIVNIIILSLSLGYMTYSIRFIFSFIIISSFCIAASYQKKGFYKVIVVIFAIFYMTILSSHISRMSLKYVLNGLKISNYNLNRFEENCYRGKVTNTLQLASSIYDTVLTNYKNAKNIAIFKTSSSSLLYLKSLSRKGYKIDFLKSANMNKYNLNKYNLIVTEGEVQDDDVFNPEDIEINYKLEGNKVIFNSPEKMQCFYSATNNNKNYIIRRSCFGYNSLKQNNNFKEDRVETFYPDKRSGMDIIKIHYFIKK